MRRLPIRVRLTAAFATAMLLVLLAAALFVALRLRADLDDQVNNNLQARTVAAVNAYREGARLAAVALEAMAVAMPIDGQRGGPPAVRRRRSGRP